MLNLRDMLCKPLIFGALHVVKNFNSVGMALSESRIPERTSSGTSMGIGRFNRFLMGGVSNASLFSLCQVLICVSKLCHCHCIAL